MIIGPENYFDYWLDTIKGMDADELIGLHMETSGTLATMSSDHAYRRMNESVHRLVEARMRAIMTTQAPLHDHDKGTNDACK